MRSHSQRFKNSGVRVEVLCTDFTALVLGTIKTGMTFLIAGCNEL
jgi:hypothetical protein